MITGSTAVSLALAEPPANRVAVQVRHHDIEEDEVRLRRHGKLERGAAVSGRDDLVTAGREDGFEQAHVLGDVVDDQDPGGVVVAHRFPPSQCCLTVPMNSPTFTGFER